MNQLEEELQNEIEKGRPVVGRDGAAYEKVFRALSKEDRAFSFPSSQIDAIIRKVRAKQIRESRRDIFWFGFGLVFIIIGFLVAVGVAGVSFDLGFLKKMSAYGGLLVFGVAFIILLNWVEKRMLRNHQPEQEI